MRPPNHIRNASHVLNLPQVVFASKIQPQVKMQSTSFRSSMNDLDYTTKDNSNTFKASHYPDMSQTYLKWTHFRRNQNMQTMDYSFTSPMNNTKMNIQKSKTKNTTKSQIGAKTTVSHLYPDFTIETKTKKTDGESNYQ